MEQKKLEPDDAARPSAVRRSLRRLQKICLRAATPYRRRLPQAVPSTSFTSLPERQTAHLRGWPSMAREAGAAVV